MPEPDAPITPEQFTENINGWEPDPGLRSSLLTRLQADGIPDLYATELSETLCRCSEATFRYLGLVNRYATVQELDQRSFLPALAELVEHLQGLRQAGFRYSVAFKQFDENARPSLTSDHFNTMYFDVIQGLDLKEYLKDVLKETAPLLSAMSLTSAELRGTRLSSLFEQCVRCQLYLRFYLMSEGLKREETWSVLFDLYNLFSGEDEGSVDVLLEDLDVLQEDLERIKKSN